MKPELPPKAGYVEVEDESGNRIYKKVPTEQDIKLEALEADRSLNENYLLDLDFRLSLIELGVI